MKAIFILLLSIITQSTFADLKLGFSQSEFQVFHIQGNLYLTCESPFDGRTEHRNLNCEDSRLFPIETDYFWGPMNNADSVRIVSRQASGQLVTQVMSYDSKIGRTKKQFQLWRKQNSQEPILTFGSNLIEYYFLSNGKIVEQGELKIDVKQQQTRQCKSKMQHSYNTNECIDVWSSCDKYLKQQNYCL